jgi:hypothetical protein
MKKVSHTTEYIAFGCGVATLCFVMNLPLESIALFSILSVFGVWFIIKLSGGI